MKWWQNKDIVVVLMHGRGAVVIFVFLLNTYLLANATVFVKLRTNTRVLIWLQVWKCRAWLFASNNTPTYFLVWQHTCHIAKIFYTLVNKNRSRSRNSLWIVEETVTTKWHETNTMDISWFFFRKLQRFAFCWIKTMKSSLVEFCLFLVLVRLTKGKRMTNFWWFIEHYV